MSEYVKVCKFCKQEIKMSDDGGKWNPYNKDGSAHDCRDNTKTSQPAQGTTSQQQNNNNEAKIAAIIQTIQSVVKQLELLKKH